MNNPAEVQLKCKKEAAMHASGSRRRRRGPGMCVSVGRLQGQVVVLPRARKEAALTTPPVNGCVLRIFSCMNACGCLFLI